MTGQQLAEHIGVSYRQVDFWTRKGYLSATDPAPGSGHARDYPAGEIAIAERMAHLVRFGVTAERAADYARYYPLIDIVQILLRRLLNGGVT